MAAEFGKVVNTPPDSGRGTVNDACWGVQNSNWDLAQQKLDAKADAEQTSQSLQEMQTVLAGKASTESVGNLTIRVQENSTKITEVGNAAKPSALAGAGLKADAADGKLEVKAGTGLSTQGGAVAVDVAGLAGAGLQVDAAGEKLDVKTGAGISTEGGAVAVDIAGLAGDGLQADDEGTALEVSIGTGLIMKNGAVAVDLAELAGPGLQVDADGTKLQVNAGAGLAVSDEGLLQISGDFSQVVNGKLDEKEFKDALLEIGEVLADKVDVSAKAASADIQDGTADKWVDAAGLKMAGITAAAIGTINGKTGGTLAMANSITVTGPTTPSNTSGATNTAPSYSTVMNGRGINSSLYMQEIVGQTCVTGFVTTYATTVHRFLFNMVNGNATCDGQWVNGSDIRLKSDITPITGALEKVLQLNGYTYKKFGNPCAGVIAQEVQKVLPEAVCVIGTATAASGETIDDTLGIDGVAVTSLLLEAIKELAAQVASLKNPKT